MRSMQESKVGIPSRLVPVPYCGRELLGNEAETSIADSNATDQIRVKIV